MKEPAQQYSETIEKLQTRIQILMDENRLLKERLDEAGVSYADIVADIVEEMPGLFHCFLQTSTVRPHKHPLLDIIWIYELIMLAFFT